MAVKSKTMIKLFSATRIKKEN